MTNKPMLSVELLNRVVDPYRREPRAMYLHNADIAELRALLDKPAESVIDLDALDWESVKEAAAESKWMPPEYMRNEWVADVCEFLRSERTAQHHGEPVAWVIGTADGNGADYYPGKGLDTLEIGAKLYAEQSAPAIKLHLNVSNVKVTVNADGSYTIDPIEQPAPVAVVIASSALPSWAEESYWGYDVARLNGR